jgi:hypothetical protein
MAVDGLNGFWRSPDLLPSQAFGYPLVTELAHDVRVLAAMAFDLPGCTGADNRSLILVPRQGAVGCPSSSMSLRSRKRPIAPSL